MKKIIINLLFIVLFLVSGPEIHSCTGFIIVDNNKVYFCNGEDWHDNDSFIAFYPAKHGEYGRIMFEFTWPIPGKPHYITDFGGINDQGLVFDEFAHKDTPLTTTHEKPRLRGEITQYCMKNCATIEEVLSTYETYNLTFMNTYQTMFADKHGSSVIIEGDEIIPKTGKYQICTNFLQSKYKGQKYPCNRYHFAESKLTNSHSITINDMKTILHGVSNPGPQYPTQYSQIYDLKEGIFYLYYFHNFIEYITINVQEELAKRKRRLHLPSLFAYMKPVFPLDGDEVEGNSLTFQWSGSRVTYELFYSTDPEFKDTKGIHIPGAQTAVADKNSILFLSLAFFPCTLLFVFKRKQVKYFFHLLVMLFCFSCSSLPQQHPTTDILQFSYTVDNLEKGNTWYWKIHAHGTEGFTSIAECGAFSTSS